MEPNSLAQLTAAVTRQAGDLNVYAGFVFAALDGALPPEYVTVERANSMFGRLRGRTPDVLGVSVRLDEQVFTLHRAAVGAPVASVIAHEVGGIVLSRQAVPLATWAEQLAAALQRLAATNQAAAAALAKLTSFTV